jgi:hypothetical protein
MVTVALNETHGVNSADEGPLSFCVVYPAPEHNLLSGLSTKLIVYGHY